MTILVQWRSYIPTLTHLGRGVPEFLSFSFLGMYIFKIRCFFYLFDSLKLCTHMEASFGYFKKPYI